MRGRLARRVRETVRGDGLAGRPVPRPGPTSHLAGMTDTLIADADGIYHPAVHENRLGAVDRDWRDWYAAYMVAEQAGTELAR